MGIESKRLTLSGGNAGIAQGSRAASELELLVQVEETLELVRRPVWRDLSAKRREIAVERIAAVASREVRREKPL